MSIDAMKRTRVAALLVGTVQVCASSQGAEKKAAPIAPTIDRLTNHISSTDHPTTYDAAAT